MSAKSHNPYSLHHQSSHTPFLAAFGFSFFWALTGVTVRLLPALSGLTITAFRCLFAAAPLLLLLWWRGDRQWWRSGWDPIAGLLIVIMLAYTLTVVLAYQRAPVAEVVLINGSSPLFVLVYRGLRRLPLRRGEVMGALLALMGLVLVVMPGLRSPAAGLPYRSQGLLLALCSSLLIAVYAMLYFTRVNGRPLPSPLLLSARIFAIGALLFPVLAWSRAPSDVAVYSLSAIDWILLVSLGALSTALPALCYSFAAQWLPPLWTTSFRLLTPVLATGFAFLLFAERPGIWVWPGGGCILLGLWFMTGLYGRSVG